MIASGKQLNVGPVSWSKTDQHHQLVAQTARIHFLLGNAGRFFRAFAVLLCAIPIHAQEQSSASSGDQMVTSAGAQASLELSSGILPTAAAIPSKIAAKKNRLLFVLPNYLTVENRQQFEPLTTRIKFKLSAKTMFDPVTISFIGMVALVGQARDSDRLYGQGFSGYAKRYGTFYSDTGVSTLMTRSIFPTLLHQDPRYFQLGRGGIWHRAIYSVSRSFITRGDNGILKFNASEIVGNAVAAGISNTYHPQKQRTLGNALSLWSTDIMLNAVSNVAKEFWPDLRRTLHKSS
jgi:hypothetical protein